MPTMPLVPATPSTRTAHAARPLRALALALALLAPAAANGCSVGRAFVSIGEVELTRDVAGVDQLRIRTNVGDVDVRTHEAERIEVRAQVSVPHDRAEELAPASAARDVRLDLQDGVLTLANAHIDDADDDDWQVSLTVRVPRVPRASISTGVGDVLARLDAQELAIVVGVGDVRTEGAVGRLDARTGVGDVDLRGAFASVEADAGTGDVSVAAERLAGGRLQSGVGSVRLSVSEGCDQDLTCTTGTGDVTLELPGTWAGTFALEAGVGDVDVPAGVAADAGGGIGPGAVVRGRHGEGGARLRVGTGVGSIHWR